MQQTLAHSATSSDELRNFRTVLRAIDVRPILQQIDDHPELWDLVRLRTDKPGTVHDRVSDIIMRYPRSGTPQYNYPAFEILSKATDVAFALMRAVRGETLGRVLISRLPPGAIIAPHDDHLPNGLPMFYTARYQIPLRVWRGVEFHCGDEQLYMEPGNAYWFDHCPDDKTKKHSVVNNSPADRISMVVDIRPYTPA